MALSNARINEIFQEYGRKGAGADALNRFRSMGEADVYEFLEFKAGNAPAPSWVYDEQSQAVNERNAADGIGQDKEYTDEQRIAAAIRRGDVAPSGGGSQVDPGQQYADEVAYLRTVDYADLTDEQGLKAWGPQWSMLKGTSRYNETSPERPTGSPGSEPPPGYVPPVDWQPTPPNPAPPPGTDIPPSGGNPTNPTNPTEPTNPTNPAEPTEPTRPPDIFDPPDPDWDAGTQWQGGGDGGGLYEWDWASLRDNQTDSGGFGEYFEPYDASAQYSPGYEASWGSDKFLGDNRDFYQNQFANLIRQEQSFQNRQNNAAVRRNEALNDPPESDLSWSWLTGGLPDVELLDSGYASPLAGLDLSGGGYQQGGATSIWDVETGSYRPIKNGIGSEPPPYSGNSVGTSRPGTRPD